MIISSIFSHYLLSALSCDKARGALAAIWESVIVSNMKTFDPYEFGEGKSAYRLPLGHIVNRARNVALLQVIGTLLDEQRYVVHAERVYKGDIEAEFELSFGRSGWLPKSDPLSIGDRIWFWSSGTQYKTIYVCGLVKGEPPNQVLEIGNEVQPYRFTELELVNTGDGPKACYPWPVFEQLVIHCCAEQRSDVARFGTG